MRLRQKRAILRHMVTKGIKKQKGEKVTSFYEILIIYYLNK